MKQRFYIGVLLGVLLASGAFSLRDHYASRFSLTPPRHVPKSEHDGPQDWLLPKDASLSTLYTEPRALFVLEAPDAITIHRAGPGSLSVGRHTFAADGVSPSSHDAATLRKTFLALNAYTLPTACAFQPGVLIRLRRAGLILDVMVCFTCEDLAWILDNPASEGQLGLSDLGVGCLRSVLRNVFPDTAELDFGQF